MPNFYGPTSPPMSTQVSSPQLLFSQLHQIQQQRASVSQSSSHLNTESRRASEQPSNFPQSQHHLTQTNSSNRQYPSTTSSSLHQFPPQSSLMIPQGVDQDRQDRYSRNISKSATFLTANRNTTSNDPFNSGTVSASGNMLGDVGKSKSAAPGKVLDTRGSLILSNSSSNHSNTNSDTSVLVHENEKFGDDFHDSDEGFLYLHPSWPVYVYTERGEVFMRVLCIKVNTKEIIVFDPFSKRVFQQGNFVDIKKISFDTNEEQDINTNFRLFRIQFNKMDTLIFLSKDRNEIINCLLYYAREFRENYDEEINIEKNPNTISFTPDINISLHHFQVFGIDRRGRFFPHTLALYSNHLRHVDSETKESFSTHGYCDIDGDVEIDPDMPTKLTIRYRDDNPYSFLVSDKDRSEVLVLLQGRSFIYRPAHSPVQIFDGVQLNTSLGEVNSTSDFPQKLAKNVAEVGVILTEPEPIKNQSGFYQKPDEDEITERNKTNLDMLQKGLRMFMHVPKKLVLRGKKTAAKQRFVRMFFDKYLNKVVVQWGESSEKLNHRAFVESIEEGKSTMIESSKISHFQNSNFSFVIYVDCKEKSATVGGRLFLVANGSVEYQHVIDGARLLIEQQQKIHNGLKKNW